MSATKQELERQVFRRTIENRTILRAEVGSTAHGINLQDGQDDLDEMGICIEPYSMAMGLTPFEQLIYRTAVERTGDHNARSEKGDLDLTIYSLRKYVRLALKGNPSILALLFVSDGLIRTKDRFGDELRFRSSFFVSKRAGHAFLGYLIAQRQRLMHLDPDGF
jgi:predicted nucleotidyltransferase